MNDDTQKFDLKTLKTNLNALKDESGLPQDQFGAIAGINAQSTVSADLSFNNTQCVTVEQLAAFAIHFGVSVDSLLGIAPAKNTGTTLAAVLENVFDLDKMADMEIGCFSAPDAPVTIYAMYFKDKRLAECLEQWHELKKTDLHADIKEQVLNLWKDSLIEDGRERRKEWDYRNKVQQAEYLTKLLIDHHTSMRISYNQLPPDYRPETEKEYFESEKFTTPLDLLDSQNRDLLKDSASMIADKILFTKEQSETFREALEWLLSDTKPLDFI